MRLNVLQIIWLFCFFFNDRESWSFKDLKETTGMQVQDLKRNIFALACGKHKILEKDADPKKVEETDTFTYNAKFKSKLVKVKIISVVQKETESENKETRGKVEEDRKIMIEACVVRIMKSRKTMDHSNLISEVTQQLQSRFMPAPLLIKKRIESLIEREYLERSKTDRKIYNYLA